MKNPRKAWLTALVSSLMLALPALVQAQFDYTTNNGTITITRYTGHGGAVVIPSTINGLPVTCIGSCAFERNGANVTSVTIPNSVTNIELGAFLYCSSLTSITIPNGVTYLDRTFEYCSGLTNVTLPDSLTSIGLWTFIHCTSLISVTIPNSVTSIGNGAFENCGSLTSITIPDSVTTIDNYAFGYCWAHLDTAPGI
jgi:hypothetical protein